MDKVIVEMSEQMYTYLLTAVAAIWVCAECGSWLLKWERGVSSEDRVCSLACKEAQEEIDANSYS